MSGASTSTITTARGPYFDELSTGMAFAQAPPVTIDAGLQAAHRAIVGNRLRLALDTRLAEAVTGGSLASPALVWDLSIGQSTVVTQRVKANLFYRGLRFLHYPTLGDTLSTRATVVGLRENAAKPGRPRTGMAALHIVTTDQDDRPVLDYWRCAMLPVSRPDAPAGPSDDLDAIGQTSAESHAADQWDLAAYRSRVSGAHFADVSPGQQWEIDGADVVSSAPELARLTGNLAQVHHDAAAAGGERLVYGGHTIGIALHQITRALPTLVTPTAWQFCHHLAPVRENDRLRSTILVESLTPRATGDGGTAQLRVRVQAENDAGTTDVLDWSVEALLA